MNSAEKILLENIDKPSSLFIFPTDTAASRWADHLLRIKGGAVAMNKFTAWDKFKQNSIKSKVQNKSSIPSALRKIFINNLIKENAEAVRADKSPLFTSLIRPKWAQSAEHFASWLTGLLPQLGIWFKKTAEKPVSVIQNTDIQDVYKEFQFLNMDGDDRDMLFLAWRYTQFLNRHNLFEPAWEEPPFNDNGRECFLFFPESLSDYSEYKQLLSSSSHVKIISITEEIMPKCDSFYYTGARREITEASLYIRALHEKQNIAWDSIAVCAADSEGYEPYLTREFENRNIPYVKRISRPLTEFPAGRFFGSVLECISRDFSFSSLSSLVTNKSLPWKDSGIIDSLMKFGMENNCLYSWTETINEKESRINAWEDAFKKPVSGIDPKCLMFFNSLKNRLNLLRKSESFSQLRRQYFIFREIFFNMENCGEETDIILSRCIAELMSLAELEKKFPDIASCDPFLFFVEHLSETNYLAQAKKAGVNILPYKTAAASPFDCHIILGAGQKSLSVIFNKLYFLSGKKRQQLNIYDEDASGVYIDLHKYNSLKQSAFFCSEHAFSGYAIPHSKTGASSKPKETYLNTSERETAFCEDLYINEFLSFNFESVDFILHDIQKNGFENWMQRREFAKRNTAPHKSDKLLEYIHKKLLYKNDGLKYSRELEGKYSVSSSSLKKYYQCSVSWLFDYILSLDSRQLSQSQQADNNLMPEFLSGMTYHSILEQFLSYYTQDPLPKPDITEHGITIPASCRQLLQKCIDSVFTGFNSIPASALNARFLLAEKKLYYFNLEKSLARFFSLFAGFTVTGSEKWYQTPRGGYYLSGKLDCLLYNEKDKKYVITDFKMSSLPKRSDCVFNEENEPCDFQLPMYITLAEENEKIEIHSSLFYSILKLKTEVITGRVHDIVTGNDFPKKEDDCISRDDQNYRRLFKIFNDKAQKFSSEIITGNFTVYESDPKKCHSCRFNSICRKTYIIKNEKNISLGKVNDQ